MSFNLSNQVYVLFPYLCSDYVSLLSNADDESLSLLPPPMSHKIKDKLIEFLLMTLLSCHLSRLP